MRTVKASEVVKGMRVEAEITRENGDRAGIAGGVTEVFVGLCVVLHTDQDSLALPLNHPVTVLAEPEPEWVEGAWYWVHVSAEYPQALLRVEGGWSAHRGATAARWLDGAPLTVLGRVLIVDWPGDDVARTLEHWPNGSAPLTEIDKAVYGVADAIRTQGGVR